MLYGKQNMRVFLCLNSSTTFQNQDVSHDQDTSHPYHSNLECTQFVTLALGHFVSSCLNDKLDTLQIAMM